MDTIKLQLFVVTFFAENVPIYGAIRAQNKSPIIWKRNHPKDVHHAFSTILNKNIWYVCVYFKNLLLAPADNALASRLQHLSSSSRGWKWTEACYL